MQIIRRLKGGPRAADFPLDSEQGQVFGKLLGLFRQARGLYSEEPFLSATSLRLYEPSQRRVIRKANLATFLAAVFGFEEVSFGELDGQFLDVFVVLGEPLSEAAGGLFLALKTIMCVCVGDAGELGDGLLARFSPSKMAEILLARHP